MKNILLATIVILFLSGCENSQVDNDDSKVDTGPSLTFNKIIDGDSFTIKTDDSSMKTIELAYIDAPEREQPYGREAKKALQDFLLNKNLELNQVSESEYLVLADGQSVNEYLVKEGFAWPQPKIEDIEIAKNYDLLKDKAISKFIGIWSLEHALRVTPWTWRKQATEPSPAMRQQQHMQRMREMQEKQRAQRQEQMQQMQQRMKQQIEDKTKKEG